MVGGAIHIRGRFRPKWLVITPKITFPVRPPTFVSEVIHDISSIVSLPDGNGVLSDISKITFGLHHPTLTP